MKYSNYNLVCYSTKTNSLDTAACIDPNTKHQWHIYSKFTLPGVHYLMSLFFTFTATVVINLAYSPLVYAVNLSNMGQEIKNELETSVNGYAYVIRKGQDFQSGNDGWAKRPVDGGVPMSIATRSFVASVTKNITAVATLQLLEDNNLSVGSKISPWLPDDWDKGVGIGELTFKDLMRHETGFKQIFLSLNDAQKENWGNDWEGLEWIVGNGAIPGSSGLYQNANFALLRVIIPKLWKATGDIDADFVQITADNHGVLYMNYVDQYIFVPSGLKAGASCTASELFGSQAMGYDATDPDESGTMSESSASNCGGHAGLRLSAIDLSLFMKHLTNGTLLSLPSMILMDYLKLGWRQSSNSGGIYAGKWWHDGVWNKGGNRGYRACIMKYADGTNATLVINSRIVGKSACSVLINAYENSK